VSNVKGSALTSRLLWVSLNHGKAGMARLAAASSPTLRGIVESGATRASWYPFDAFIELNERVDALFGAGDIALVRELGRYSADANLTTIYRLFFKFGAVHWILTRAPRLWGMHYDAGRVVVRAPSGGHEAELEVIDYDTPHRVHCLSVVGWIERSVELSGGKDVVLDELECRAQGGSRCLMRVRWT
jgi:hypothetical protein